MTRPGYQEGSEPMWWWRVAQHLDEAQRTLANAMAHNVDDPRPVHALQERLREGQAILLEIFHVKGLLPASTNGKVEAPMAGMPAVLPMPEMDPTTANGEVAAVPEIETEQPLVAQEPAVAEADQAIAEPETAQQRAAGLSPEVAAPVADVVDSSSVALPAVPGPGDAG